MSNPPRPNWTAPDATQFLTLLPRTRYNFTLVVSDDGAAPRAHLVMPAPFELLEVTPESVVEDVGVLGRRLTLRGNRSDPRTGLIISGRFESGATDLSFEFLAEGDDFGGTSGRTNQTFLSVNSAVYGFSP